MIVTLIGYRGTGKSTLAFPLAERLGWTAIDADAELERRAGRSIRDIFATDGEAGFRQLERDVLVDLLQQDRQVLAAGGGAILNPLTRADFKAAGPVVWLQAAPESILRRISGDETTAERRPNLTAGGGLKEIQDLLEFREPLYRECASLSVATDAPLPGSDGTALPTSDELLEFVLGEVRRQLDVSPEASA